MEEPIKNSDGEITGYKWIWSKTGVFFAGPLFTGMNFTPLLPNSTIKIDFEVADSDFYFMSNTTTDLKVSFDQAVLKVPKYQLETSLYEALLQKIEHNPLKLYWNSTDVQIHTLGKGVRQEVINLHCKPIRIFVGLMGNIIIFDSLL